jgi:CrcB protein
LTAQGPSEESEHDLPIDPDLPPPGRRLRPSALVSVWVGGALGTVARYGVARAWAAPTGTFPWAIFVINTSGAFLLGFLLTVLVERLSHREAALRPLLATGVLGGWTTFSTFVVGVDSLVHAGHPAGAVGYLAATVVAGIAAVALGWALARRCLPPGVGAAE